MKALLLVNGQPPKQIPNREQYDVVYATDGAYAKMKKLGFEPDVVVGDFDSIPMDEIPPNIKVEDRPNQDYTDFDKCLQLMVEKGIEAVDVYGATGMEHDHFLGNLSTALQFKNKIQIKFFDDFSEFYLTPKNFSLEHVKDRVISLFPFPKAVKVSSQGLQYPLNHLTLEMGKKIGIRNKAIDDVVNVSYEEGELIVFISNYIKD